MNINCLPKTNSLPHPILLDELADIVEVQLTDRFEPTLLDLNQIFGAQELCFEAAVETSSVVDLKLLKNRGILILQTAEDCPAERVARVAVRATAPDGLSTAVIFQVKVVQQLAA